MEKIIPTITPGSSAEEIANLQAALMALKYKIDKLELGIPPEYGRTTILAVTQFQENNAIVLTSEWGAHVGEVTANKINELLGLNSGGEGDFVVSGTVLNKWGKPATGLTVLLYDVDLRGVDTYLDASMDTGRQKLGSAVTGKDGQYRIEFSERDFVTGETEPALPDVVAVVWGEGGKSLAASELKNGRTVFGNSRKLTGLDIHIESVAARGDSEFRQLMTALDKPLDGFPIHSLSERQVSFLAEETGLEVEKIKSLVKSAQVFVALRQLVKPEVKEWNIAGSGRRAILLHEADIVELLYGLDRSGVTLELPQLAGNHNLDETLAKATEENIVSEYPAAALAALEMAINGLCTRFVLEVDESGSSVATRQTLDIAFSDDSRLKTAYLSASLQHGGDMRNFLENVLPTLPEFKRRPEAVQAIRTVQAFSILTQQNLPLVATFVQERQFQSDRDLVRHLDRAEWTELVRGKGVPFDLSDKDDVEKERLTQQYIDGILMPLENFHAGAYIAREINRGRLNLPDRAVAEGVQVFFDRTPEFDLRSSKVFHFDDHFERIAAENNREAVKESVKTFQRLALISPTMESAVKLHDLGYMSAFQIGGLPEQQFMAQYAESLGGEVMARKIYQQAAFSRFVNDALLADVHARAQMPVFAPPAPGIYALLNLSPDIFLSDVYKVAPNLQNLFGQIDLCECQHCNSVYSPAAYFVDLLHYLEGFSTRQDRADAPKNSKGETPFQVLMARRPDLQEIPLSCENTNTVMPYIDLVNEVLEYYVYHKNLTGAPHDNENTESVELLADALHFTEEAYKKLADDTVYPFSLPYHQPLDVMRRHLPQLGTNRRELMQVFMGLPAKDSAGRDVDPVRALAAETLSLDEAEYKIFTRETFAPRFASESVVAYESAIGIKTLPEYFGYEADSTDWIEKIAVLPEFLRRTGLSYEETVAIVNARFVNPGLEQKQQILKDLISLYPFLTGKSSVFLGMTIDIGSSNLAEFLGDFVFPYLFKDPEQAVADMPSIMPLAIEKALGESALDFVKFLRDNQKAIASTMVIVNEVEGCSLEKAKIGTLGGLARAVPANDLLPEAEQSVFTRFLMFTRLWKKWGGRIDELDEVLSVLPPSTEFFSFKAFSTDFIGQLAALKDLQELTGLPLLKLASWWGNIQTTGEKSLYAKLFLSKALQRIDTIFQPSPIDGKYLTDSSDDKINQEQLKDHVPVLLAAFQLTEANLQLILNDAGLTLNDRVSIENLSRIYRYGTMAKAIGLRIPDFLRVKRLLSLPPFSTPEQSLEFIETAFRLRDSAVPLQQLDFLFNNVAYPEIEPSPVEINALSLKIWKGLDAIETDTAIQADLQGEITRRQLSRLYDSTTTDRVVATLNGTANPVLFASRRQWFVETFTFLTNDPALNTLLDNILPGDSDQTVIAGRFKIFLEHYLPYLTQQLKDEFVLNTLGESFGTTPEMIEVLLGVLGSATFFEKALTKPDNFSAAYQPIHRAMHRAMLVVQQFQLDAKEVVFLQAHKDQTDSIPGFDFTFSTSGHTGLVQWMSLLEYRSLTKSLPSRQALRLLDVFDLPIKKFNDEGLRNFLFELHGIGQNQVDGFKLHYAVEGYDEADYLICIINRQAPGDAHKLRKSLHKVSSQTFLLAYLTGWDMGTVYATLRVEGLNILTQAPSLAFLSGLQRKAAFQRRSGVEAAKLYEWAQPSLPDFNAWVQTAQDIKRTVKSRYEDSAWSDVAKLLNDPLRESQKQALIAYLLAPGHLANWPLADANDLFGYFLIDVLMDACMETSRLKQAISAVQLFIQRCFLNLEPEVPPHLLDAKIWEWMKHYRVWEANRKVFLYPENWIEPEYRDNKTELFKAFESGLLQNEMQEESVSERLGTYLHELLKVSKLKICGSYLECYETISFSTQQRHKKLLHVIGRTENKNTEFFYCFFNYENSVWSSWTKIPLNINLIVDFDGLNVESIMTMVIRKGILYIFWIEFVNKSTIDNQSTNEKGDYIFNLFWSKFNNGTWVPAFLGTKDKVIHDYVGYSSPYAMFSFVDDSDNINILIKYYEKTHSSFYFDVFEHFEKTEQNEILYTYSNNYEYTSINSSYKQPDSSPWKLNLLGPSIYWEENIILSNVDKLTNQLLLPFSELDEGLRIPFYPVFYLSRQKTYLIENLSTYGLKYSGHASSDNGEMGLTAEIIMTKWILKFILFFHPYAASFISTYKLGGKKSLWNTSTQKITDKAESFESLEPRIDIIVEPYPIENIDFRFEGSALYSIYNWEIFFHIPLMVAKRFLQNQQFQEAFDWLHCIFDPTTDEKTNLLHPTGRYWKLLPFREEVTQSNIENLLLLLTKKDLSAVEAAQRESLIQQWKALQQDPFKPHLVARKRITAYMKKTVMLYVDTLIAAGDAYFRRDMLEDIQTATQYYVMASSIMGPKPQFISRRDQRRSASYREIRERLDAFSNVRREIENLTTLPASNANGDSTVFSANGAVLSAAGGMYFCIPYNDNLLAYWDTIEDRLFKIRHCQNIEGVERQLPLFEPPIDPALLVQATAQGLSIEAVLQDVDAPLPHYRFQLLAQKASEVCAEVRSTGANLLNTIEKKDSTHLELMRARQEVVMLRDMVVRIKEKEIENAQQQIQVLNAQIEAEFIKYKEAAKRLGEKVEELTNGDLPSLMNAKGGNLSIAENKNLEFTNEAQEFSKSAAVYAIYANQAHILPNISTGTGTSVTFGGSNIGAAIQAFSMGDQESAKESSFLASKYLTSAQYERRDEQWRLEGEIASRTIKQLRKQKTVLDIQVQIKQWELENHQKQTAFAQEIEAFLTHERYANEHFYEWMKGELKTLYRQCYDVAYDLAKKAERAWRFELGETKSDFIQYGYWDNAHDGLLSGEKLYLSLKQMERAYLDNYRREQEITKHISLLLHDPLSLIRLKEIGKCEVELPETLFDMDYPGHYMRRIKSVSLTIPCILGPYTSLNCKLTLLSDITRLNSRLTNGNRYPEDLENEDMRFHRNYVPVQSIAISHGQNDSGMFELNFRDERYLPFEGAGAVSRWRIELPDEFRQFDYETISDVILHLRYTARDGGSQLKKAATTNLKDMAKGSLQTAAAISSLKDVAKDGSQIVTTGGFYRVFSLQHEFPNEWHLMLRTKSGQDTAQLALGNLYERLPYFAKYSGVEQVTAESFVLISSVEVLAPTIQTPDGKMISLKNSSDILGGLQQYIGAGTGQALNLGEVSHWILSFASSLPKDTKDMWLIMKFGVTVKDDLV